MNLEGLQELLKKKKQPQLQQREAIDRPSAAVVVRADASPHTCAPSNRAKCDDATATATFTGHATARSGTNTNGGPGGTTSDPYAAALQCVQSLQQQPREHQEVLGVIAAGQKRSREDMERESKLDGALRTSAGSSGVEASDVPNVSSAASVSAPRSALSNTPTVPPMRSDKDVLAQRELGVAVLQTCLIQLEHYWVTELVSNKSLPSTGHSTTASTRASAASQPQHQPSSSSALPASSVPLSATASPPIPRALREYLATRFAAPNVTAMNATGLPEMTVLDREFEFLAQLKAEVEAAPQHEAMNCVNTADDKVHAVPEEQQQLAELLRAVWYLVALRWQHSLDPHQLDGRCCVASTTVPQEGLLAPAQQGWSPVLYLALQNALPAGVRLVQGRAIAEEVDRWRALARTRQDALELLSYVCSDFETSAAASLSSTTAAAFVIPADLRKNLHTMVVRHLQEERDFIKVRQDYVDITMGTANWKLGLFSGGEVHMRRSMERVERNRIAHLLNNEHATHLLQAVRELTIFAEQHLAVARSLRFFFRSAERA